MVACSEVPDTRSSTSYHECLFVLLTLVALLPSVNNALPVEALQELGTRTVSKELVIASSGAMVTEKENSRILRSAQGLPTSKEGLIQVLENGTPENGIIARAATLSACFIKTGQGRRVSILNAGDVYRIWTQFELEEGRQRIRTSNTSVLQEPFREGQSFTVISLDNYPFDSLRAKSNTDVPSKVTEIDSAKVNNADRVADLRELCDYKDENENSVSAQDRETLITANNITLRENNPFVENPFARLPANTGRVKIRYDTYEIVLQTIAVALLLLDLFILEDMKDKKLGLHHIFGIGLLLIATVVTTIMGYMQILDILGSQAFAWQSCGSYDLKPTEAGTNPKGVLYRAYCEWVVIRATSTRASYLIFVPSALGALLLLVILVRFIFIKCRNTESVIHEEDHLVTDHYLVKEEEIIRPDIDPALSPRSKRRRFGAPFWKKHLTLSICIAALISTGQCQFPPTSVEVVGPNFVANNEVLFLGGVAATSPWRCTWESAVGPADDSTSIDGIDDCFVRWTPPTEDKETGLLFGKAEIMFKRCSPVGRRCPFTGTSCPDIKEKFNCTPRLRVPKPLNFFREWEVKRIKRLCKRGSREERAFCRLHLIKIFAKIQLIRLTRQIKRKLGDERPNFHRISEYEFPDCAGPPKNLSGSDAGKGTLPAHFSTRGDFCVNSPTLSAIAYKNSRRSCREKIAEERLCKSLSGYEKKRCKWELTTLCTDVVYTTLLIKSRFMRATDDWLVSRCHQSRRTSFGRLKNWRTNRDAVLFPSDKIPRDPDSGFPLVRPVRQGWKFTMDKLEF